MYTLCGVYVCSLSTAMHCELNRSKRRRWISKQQMATDTKLLQFKPSVTIIRHSSITVPNAIIFRGNIFGMNACSLHLNWTLNKKNEYVGCYRCMYRYHSKSIEALIESTFECTAYTFIHSTQWHTLYIAETIIDVFELCDDCAAVS